MAPSRSGVCSSSLCLLLVSSLSVWIRGGEAVANIDILEPIVRTSPAGETAGDLFGYSATLHQIQVPRSFEDALRDTRYGQY